MDDKSGWIALHRRIQNNPLWKEPRTFSKAEAWIDIMMEVRWNIEPGQVMIKHMVLMCNRGECLYSIETWASRWGWTKSRARRFLNLLKKMGQIDTQSETHTTRLTVLNYDTYNPLDTQTDTQANRRRTAGEPQAVHNLTSKEGEQGNKKDSLSVSHPTPSEFLEYWNSQNRLTKIKSMSEKRAGQLTVRKKDIVFRENWLTIIEWLNASDFCCGQNERNWTVSVDWLLKNSTNYVKVLEGKYANGTGTQNGDRLHPSIGSNEDIDDYLKAGIR